MSENIAWQPIETAPMDGTPVLLYARAAFATAPVRVVGWWIYGQHWVACTFSPNKPTVLVPTHWMPLPTPPGEQS
ncbi:DUF551 domain-containing protein [Cupriavidus taiwanensis]|uniref:DUF551 domain-containing protein n=1 Tax=Cupriavidus taiwanensis TaxID=164546 RepID=UPI000E1AF4A8|nr:conserved hypothetical protein [Cupriavidus taiwanensis]